MKLSMFLMNMSIIYERQGELTHLIGVLTTEENTSELLDVIEVSA